MTEIEVTDQDTANVHVGDTLVVRLAETPSTGFTWIIEIAGTGVSVTGDTQAGNPDPRPGAAGQRVFVLDATAPGQADVTLTLARPWDSASASETRHIHVVVES